MTKLGNYVKHMEKQCKKETEKRELPVDNIVSCGVDWYKTLTMHQKINAKECFELLCGCKWSDLSTMFTMRERIEIMYDKLLMEGFQV